MSHLYGHDQTCEDMHRDVEEDAAGMEEGRDELSNSISMQVSAKTIRVNDANQTSEHSNPR